VIVEPLVLLLFLNDVGNKENIEITDNNAYIVVIEENKLVVQYMHRSLIM